ncbi:MAG: alanine racemase [Oligoflexia bacterium]|nr:alanine racemase [Oligoflexia bacterium]
MLGRYRNTFAEVNLQTLAQNYLTLQQLAGETGLIPMVKADAYGHGDIQVAKVCERLGAKFLGVALIEEGVKLRLNGIQTPILVFGFFDSIGADAIVKYRLTPVLSEPAQFEFLKTSLHESASYPVHVKFNTGMHRLGFEPSQLNEVIDFFEQSNFLKLEGICSHFLSTEAFDSQENIFQNVIKILKSKLNQNFLTHISNSAGIIKGLKNRYDLARPGISLYGYGSDKVKPVLSLKSTVSLLRNVKKGEVVSYGAQWKAPKDSLIAVVALGYADGMPRNLSNLAEVLINSTRCPVRGVICMDYFMVDVSHIADHVAVGDEIVIIGSQKDESITAEELAKNAHTISYEILTGIQVRVPRVFVH